MEGDCRRPGPEPLDQLGFPEFSSVSSQHPSAPVIKAPCPKHILATILPPSKKGKQTVFLKWGKIMSYGSWGWRCLLRRPLTIDLYSSVVAFWRALSEFLLKMSITPGMLLVMLVRYGALEPIRCGLIYHPFVCGSWASYFIF